MMKSLVFTASGSFPALSASVSAELDPPVPVRTVPREFPTDMRRRNISGAAFRG
jgi:hypothetical protein